MKVFEYNPFTGVKGALIAEIARPDALSNRYQATCVLPNFTPDQSWIIATEATDHKNNPIKFDRPVCFCLGQWTAGEDTAWQWVVLLPMH